MSGLKVCYDFYPENSGHYTIAIRIKELGHSQILLRKKDVFVIFSITPQKKTTKFFPFVFVQLGLKWYIFYIYSLSKLV